MVGTNRKLGAIPKGTSSQGAQPSNGRKTRGRARIERERATEEYDTPLATEDLGGYERDQTLYDLPRFSNDDDSTRPNRKTMNSTKTTRQEVVSPIGELWERQEQPPLQTRLDQRNFQDNLRQR